MCRKLVTHYFLLTHDDLELWDSDPESFGKFVSYILYEVQLGAFNVVVDIHIFCSYKVSNSQYQNFSYDSGISLSGHIMYDVSKICVEILLAVSCNVNVKDVKCFAIHIMLVCT